MFPIFKMFKREKKSKITLLSKIKELSILTDEIGKQEKKLKQEEYTSILEFKEEFFIPLTQFMNFVEKQDISVDDMLNSCKHISDLDKSKFSFIDVYPIIENDKIILSLKPDERYSGQKIRLVTARIVNE